MNNTNRQTDRYLDTGNVITVITLIIRISQIVNALKKIFETELLFLKGKKKQTKKVLQHSLETIKAFCFDAS